MADEFYNPYHFVPADGVEAKEEAASVRDGHWPADKVHDRYGKDLLHGRITCRIRLRTPLVLGAEHEEARTDYTKVTPYRLSGKVAIPATSLKGLLSTVAEAASKSAMRVLADTKPISWRQTMRDPEVLSALGRLERDTDGTLKLRPLTAPTFHISTDISKWVRLFQGNMPLKALFGEYRGNNRRRNFAPDNFESQISFEGPEETWDCPQRGPVYYADAVTGFTIDAAADFRHGAIWPRLHERKGFIFGQRITRMIHQDALLQSHKQFELTSGFLRVLGGHRRADMAAKKKHEAFVPFNENRPKADLLPIAPLALDRFQSLADQRSEAVKSEIRRERNERRRLKQARPYTPFGSTDDMLGDREAVDQDGRLKVRLREGQLVYFDFDETADGPEVCRISFSSIWRSSLEVREHIVSMHDLFRKVDPELLPMNETRAKITMAEWLFGFVESGTAKNAERAKKLLAYRGRLRISPARLPCSVDDEDALFMREEELAENPRLHGHVRLRELSSPKAPSPSLYFQPDPDRGQNSIGFQKRGLRLGDRPNGRKLYLHDLSDEAWRTRQGNQSNERFQGAAKRKMAVRPLDPEKVNEIGGFQFDVEFDNLTEDELNLVCFALRPTEEFWHKLGAGKPIGLGSIEIEPIALQLVDRRTRYRAENPLEDRQRYHSVWREGMAEPTAASPADRSARWAKRLETRDRDALFALNEIGTSYRLSMPGSADPAASPPVSYPLAPEQSREAEHFRWFVNNEKWWATPDTEGEWLRPLADGAPLRALRRVGEPPNSAGPKAGNDGDGGSPSGPADGAAPSATGRGGHQRDASKAPAGDEPRNQQPVHRRPKQSAVSDETEPGQRSDGSAPAGDGDGRWWRQETSEEKSQRTRRPRRRRR